MRHGTARQPGARPPGNDRHAQLMTGTQHVDDLPLVFRQADSERQLAIGGEPVALVGAQVLLVDQQAMRWQVELQAPDQAALVHRKYLVVWDCHAGDLSGSGWRENH